ncbi:hypothetical protein SARC_04931 [Sphaeroforma arctica JP610]|uniref:PH domain-containing protein n=1 Tax=Sphaeroforma arctica JP610 TaxID=667725 RepID=A0A0L0G3L6_9EUKA|nr:hypothetical protein SARC_04931 [Sphaeroforma arctica JP610]KNC82798.1 hypothetical protein SARC_04931 [Sphaeroforma arctica JP610]|eukprot:XP_014156700.1 hypothetical protein SARC_04931 [Sphaeroforma arctica JP610]
MACYFGHREVVEILIGHEADVNIQNDSGDTALHKAALTGRGDIVQCLLARGADTRIKNATGELPATLAQTKELKDELTNATQVQRHRRESVFLEAARKGDIQEFETEYKRSTCLDINCADDMGNTPLHLAANRGHKDLVVWLLQNGARSLRNAAGKTPAEIAYSDQLRQLLESLSSSVGMRGILFRFHTVLRRWRKRGVVLRKGMLRFYQVSGNNDFEDLIDVYTLSKHSVIDVTNESIFEFVVETKTSKLKLRAETEHELARWMASFQQYSGDITIKGFTKTHVHTHAHASPHPNAVHMSLEAIPELLVSAAKLRQSVAELVKDAEVKALELPEGLERDSAVAVAQQFEVPLRQIHTLISSLGDVTTTLSQKEKMWAHELQRERQARVILEESLKVLAVQHNDLETIADIDHALLREAGGGDADGSEAFYDAVSVIDANEPRVSIPEIEPSRTRPPRTTLPAPQTDQAALSVWSVLKQSVGKDLTKISMPVVWNEPLSLLQRLSEDLEYHSLLKMGSDVVAGKTPSSPLLLCSTESERAQTQMLYVAAFAASTYSSTSHRVGKPFNPLLGETYELVLGSNRLVCEQVSHHPPISAIHAEGETYEIHGWSDVKTKFWGKSMEVLQRGGQHLRFKSPDSTVPGHHYSWNKVTTSVNNIIIGKLWLDNHGLMTITNHTTGDTCELDFKQSGWFNKNMFCVEGRVLDSQGNSVYHISGKWNESLWAWPSTATKISLPELKNAVRIWQIHAPLPDKERMYNMTRFAVTLNEMPADPSELARTDCRLRPDQRCLEEGDVEKAADEKVRLEEKQRAARKIRAETGEVHKPMWFEEVYDDVFQATGYRPTGEFWRAKHEASTKWSDIY